MLAIDTNVLVRLITNDDAAQSPRAKRLFETNDIYIPTTVMLETSWVLTSRYGFAPAGVVDVLLRLCGLSNVQIEHPERCAQALAWARDGMDFADALHLAASHQAEAFLTFDQKLIKSAKGLSGVVVRAP